ncbi:MAG: GIY-YIG nuclease family protein [Bacteroidota bacterium]
MGSTSGMMVHLSFHNAGLQRSTRNRIPFKRGLFEKYDSKEEVLKREKQIKSWKEGEAFKKMIAGEVVPPPGGYLILDRGENSW